VYAINKINKLNMNMLNYLKFLSIIVLVLLLNSCGGKFPGADARKFPADPEERVKKNLAEGRGFRFDDVLGSKGGDFQFASSNELWRASLDTIDFIPLSSVNYSGGIIVTDWYSSEENPNESIKISIRFLSNEIRADALDIKIFNRNCLNNSLNCKVSQTDGVLVSELNKKILKTAAVYKEENKKNKKSN